MLIMKSKKLAALCCAIALVFTCAIPAFASSHSYKFTFSGSGASKQQASSYWAKGDSEQTAYVSIKKATNWSIGTDRVYLWIHANDGTDRTYTNEHFEDYGDYELPYTTYTEADTLCTLQSWHNNNGTSKTFSVSGNFTP